MGVARPSHAARRHSPFMERAGSLQSFSALAHAEMEESSRRREALQRACSPQQRRRAAKGIATHDVVRELHSRMPMLYWILWLLGNKMIHDDAAVVSFIRDKLRGNTPPPRWPVEEEPHKRAPPAGWRRWPLRLWRTTLFALVPLNWLQLGCLFWEASHLHRTQWRLDSFAFIGMAVVFGIGKLSHLILT